MLISFHGRKAKSRVHHPDPEGEYLLQRQTDPARQRDKSKAFIVFRRQPEGSGPFVTAFVLVYFAIAVTPMTKMETSRPMR
ncbi:MAG TPA: hypothetical protein VKT76_04355 [Bradyrhizobium sp.]|nr:hypothetical protein [Bradyrhizobium sp.]